MLLLGAVPPIYAQDDLDHQAEATESAEGPSSADAPVPEESPAESPPTSSDPPPEDVGEATPPADDPAIDLGAKPTTLLNRAYELSKKIETPEEATRMIELCEAALLKKPPEQFVEYARQLTSWAYNRRGELLADQGLNDESLSDFERAIVFDPKRWKAFHNRAISLAMLGRYDMALLDFDQAIQLKPNYANAYYNRGELHYERGNYQKAIDDYNSAIRYAPRDSEAYNSRGHAYYKTGNLTRAIADYDRAIQFDAENAAAYVNRGDAYTDTGEYARAAADYRNAIRLAPALGRAYQSSAWLMATAPDERIRHPQFALEAAQRAIQLDGENYRYLDTLAAAYANAGDFENARAAETKAIELAPADTAQAYRARLALYEAERPFRDNPPGRNISTARNQPPSGRGR
jgi:tetratricopeptide (TPR) repeat protein